MKSKLNKPSERINTIINMKTEYPSQYERAVAAVIQYLDEQWMEEPD